MATSMTGLLGMWTVLAPLLLSLSGVLANVNDEVSHLSFQKGSFFHNFYLNIQLQKANLLPLLPEI